MKAAWLRIRKVAAVIRLKPFDTTTPEGQSYERYRRIILTAFSAGAARSLGLVSILVSVPLTVTYLGEERYGLWMTISSVVGLLSFTDLGVGNGLLNAVAAMHGANDRVGARRFAASALLILTLMAAVLGILFFVAYAWVPWPKLYNVLSEQARAEAGPATATLVICFLVSVPLSTIPQLRLAYQEGFVNNAWQAVGGLLGLIALLWLIYFRAGLPWLILAVAGAPVLTTALNGWHLFQVSHPWLWPSWQALDQTAVAYILKRGGLFLILQIAGAVGYQTDNIVIAQFLGADQVTHYVVPLKLFSLVPMVLSFFLAPMWPAYREALIRRDVPWARRTLSRSFLFSLAVSVPLVVTLIIFGRPILNLWVGPVVVPSLALLVGFGLWALSTSLSGPLAMFLNGADVVAFQVVTALCMAVANLALSIGLVRLIGLPGPIFGTLIAQLMFILLPSLLYLPRLFARLAPSEQSQLRN